MISGMISSIRMDRAGRIVIPKAVRERLGFRAGSLLIAEERTGGVLIRPEASEPILAVVDGLLVHQGTARSRARWERVIDAAREERLERNSVPLNGVYR